MPPCNGQKKHAQAGIRTSQDGDKADAP